MPVTPGPLFSRLSREKWHDPAWQIKNRYQGADGLKRLPLDIPPDEIAALHKVSNRYRWASTPYYLSLINWDDPHDPVRLQSLPGPEELCSPSSMRLSDDPLCERKHTRIKGLVHRYPDRALLLVTGNCVSYCRHCNRKRTWKKNEAALNNDELYAIYNYIKQDRGIREVILSGGDPLTLPLERLEQILALFRKIPHVEVLRIGSRLPVTMPMGITPELCKILARHRPLWLNTHFNHPVEITGTAEAACDRLQKSGIPVSNQTVLLRGVNDSFDTLSKLFRNLEAIMVRPYYLFHCEPVSGNLHFIPSIKKGLTIMRQINRELGGLCVPSYVLDLPGGGGKARLPASDLLEFTRDGAIFRNWDDNIEPIKLPGPALGWETG